MSPATRGQATGIAGLGAGGIIVLGLLPVAADEMLVAQPLGLLALLAGFGAVAMTLAAVAALAGNRHLVAARLEAASLWAACGLAVLLSAAAVTASASALDLRDIVFAQDNTGMYLLHQPVAAALFLAAVALAGQEPALAAVLGPRTRPRLVAEALVVAALAATFATLFLGGFAGGGMPEPLLLALKTSAAALVLVLARGRLAGLAHGPRLALAWLAALAGLVNLAGTIVLVGS
jgi:NADH-quinone oxidoreductase subunit H